MSRWLLLAHQLPAKPSNARVKTWRRLQTIGAVPIRNSVYVLPNTDACREDFEWIRTEIVAFGGDATVFAGDTIDSAGDADIEDAFRHARDLDYAALTHEAKALGKRLPRSAIPKNAGASLARTAAIRERLAAIRRIDFFQAAAGEAAAAALDALEQRLGATYPKETPMRITRKDFVHRRWVTRPRPGVDRMSSAWLIRRYIDPKATFAFVAEPGARDVAFDMYTGEFSHQGERCTFEVLTQRFGIEDVAVERVAQIVHDLDMKENRYSAPEAPAVGRMVDGLRQLHADDATLLAQGMAMFEALARSFESSSQPRDRGRRSTAKRRKRT